MARHDIVLFPSQRAFFGFNACAVISIESLVTFLAENSPLKKIKESTWQCYRHAIEEKYKICMQKGAAIFRNRAGSNIFNYFKGTRVEDSANFYPDLIPFYSLPLSLLNLESAFANNFSITENVFKKISRNSSDNASFCDGNILSPGFSVNSSMSDFLTLSENDFPRTIEISYDPINSQFSAEGKIIPGFDGYGMVLGVDGHAFSIIRMGNYFFYFNSKTNSRCGISNSMISFFSNDSQPNSCSARISNELVDFLKVNHRWNVSVKNPAVCHFYLLKQVKTASSFLKKKKNSHAETLWNFRLLR